MEQAKKKGVVGWVIAIVVVAAVIIVYAVSNKGGQNGAIKVGFIGPLTGDASLIGQSSKNAVQLAVDEVNQSGGVNGKQLQVIYEDGQCTGTAASNAASKLINVDQVPVIIGGACSAETAAFTGLAKQTNTVVLSYCSSAPTLTGTGIFRDYPSDTFQGSFAADYVYSKLGKKNAAILYVNTDYGSGIEKVFTTEFEKDGGRVVFDEGYNQSNTDFRTLLSKVKSANPDVLYFLGYTQESIAMLKQAKDLGITIMKFGGDAWDDPNIFTGAGSASEGIMYSKVSSPLNDTFKAAMEKTTNSNVVSVCAPQAYDAAKIIAQVISQVGTNPTAIRNALYNVDYKGGVSSNEIKFDSNGDLIGASYEVMAVHNGASSPAPVQ